MTDYNELIDAATAALRALRSYQYGNSSTGLAEEVADALEAALTRSLKRREEDLQKSKASSR